MNRYEIPIGGISNDEIRNVEGSEEGLVGDTAQQETDDDIRDDDVDVIIGHSSICTTDDKELVEPQQRDHQAQNEIMAPLPKVDDDDDDAEEQEQDEFYDEVDLHPDDDDLNNHEKMKTKNPVPIIYRLRRKWKTNRQRPHPYHYHQHQQPSDLRQSQQQKQQHNVEIELSSSIRSTSSNIRSSSSPIIMSTRQKNRASWFHVIFKNIAAITGNILEWYDFAIAGYFSDILSILFFPSSSSSSTTTATTADTAASATTTDIGSQSSSLQLQSHHHHSHSHHTVNAPSLNRLEAYAIFGFAFLMRPIGGMIIGYIGDKNGRKYSLELSIFAISITTTLMGLLPTYKQIGPASIILLLVVRMLQGLCIGGQLMSSLVYTLEGSTGNRNSKYWGLKGSCVLVASPFGFFLGGIVSFAIRSTLTQQQILDWGWRLPHLSGIFIAFCGIYLKYCCKQDEIYASFANLSEPIPQIDIINEQDDVDEDHHDHHSDDDDEDEDVENDVEKVPQPKDGDRHCGIKGDENGLHHDIPPTTTATTRKRILIGGLRLRRYQQVQQQQQPNGEQRPSGGKIRKISDRRRSMAQQQQRSDNNNTAITNTTENPLRLAFAKENRRALFGAALIPVMWSGGFYLCYVWLAIYMRDLIVPPIEQAFAINSFSLLLLCIWFPIAGVMSDCLGRKIMMTFGGFMFGAFGPIAIFVIGRYNTPDANGEYQQNSIHSLWIPFGCQLVLSISLACYGAPMCAWLVEAFEPKLRSTSVCIGYNIAQAIAGSLSPILATQLVQKVGVGAPGIILVVLSMLSMMGLWCVAPQRQQHAERLVSFSSRGSRTTGATRVELSKEIC